MTEPRPSGCAERDDHDLPEALWKLVRGRSGDAAPGGEESRVEDLSTRERLGRYRLLSELGKGGMGVVFRAFDEEAGRLVALKVLRASTAFGDQCLARFLREGEILRRLRHCGIVGAHDFECIEGVWCLAMELVEGPTLAACLDALASAGTDFVSSEHLAALPAPVSGAGSGPTAEPAATPASFEDEYARRVAAIGRTVARALETAHEAGIVHRDIKPGNLMWSRDGQIKVVDFGLAAFCDDLAQSLSGGDPVGTLRYMAPERLRGGGHARDPRCDIYSLGATLYELLTFQQVFAGDDPKSVALKVLLDAPVSPRRHRNSVPRDLERIVLRCLEKDPGERYGSAAELAGDFDRFLRGVRVRPSRGKPFRQGARLVSRRPVTAIVVAAALLVAAILAFDRWNGAQEDHAAEVSEQYARLLREGRTLVRSGWSPHVARMQSGTRFERAGSGAAEERFRRAADLLPERPEAWNQLARILPRRLGPAAPEVHEAIEHARVASPGNPFALAQLARWHRQNGDAAAAEAVVAELKSTGQQVALDWLAAWDAFDRCDWNEAIDRFQVLIDDREELFPGARVDVHLASATARFNVRDYDGVEIEACAVQGLWPDNRESMILQSHVRMHTHGPDAVYKQLVAWLGPGPDVDAVLDVVAFWKERVRPDLMARTLELVSPADRVHPHVRAWNAWLRRLEAPGEATRELDELVAMNPDDIFLVTLQGETWCQAGDSAKALEIFKLATDRFPRSALLWYHRALEHWCFDEFAQAYDSFERSLALDINPNVLTYHGRVAWEESIAAREAGDHDRNRESLARAREQLERSFEYFPWNFATLQYLTRVLNAQGEYGRVDVLLDRYEKAYGEYYKYHVLLAHFDPERALQLSRLPPPAFERDRWIGHVIDLHRRLDRRVELGRFLYRRAAAGDSLGVLRHVNETMDWTSAQSDELELFRSIARMARSEAPDDVLVRGVSARVAARLGARKELGAVLSSVDERYVGVWSEDVVRALIATRPHGTRRDAALELLERGIVPVDSSLPLLQELVTCGDARLEERGLAVLLRIVAERDPYPLGMQRVLGEALRHHRSPPQRVEIWRKVLRRFPDGAEARAWLAEALFASARYWHQEGEDLLVAALRDLEDPAVVYRAVSWLAGDLELREHLRLWRSVERRLGDEAPEPIREAIARTCTALEPLLDGPQEQRWSASDRSGFAAGKLWLPGAFALGGRRVPVRPGGRLPVSEAWQFEPEATAAFAIPVVDGSYDVLIVAVKDGDGDAKSSEIRVEGKGVRRTASLSGTPLVAARYRCRVTDGCLDVRLVPGDTPTRIAAVEVQPRSRVRSGAVGGAIGDESVPALPELLKHGAPSDVARELVRREGTLGPLPPDVWLALAARLETESWTVEAQAEFWNAWAAVATTPVVERLARYYEDGGGRNGVRIDCGSRAVSVACGWSPDGFATSGVPVNLDPSAKARIVRADCQAIYESFREPGSESSLSYAIPVKPGAYVVRLHLTQLEPLDPEPNRFDVWLEDRPVQTNVWVFAEGGRRIWNEVLLPYSTVVKDGLLELRLASRGRYGARLFGLEVLPVEAGSLDRD